MSCGSLMPLSIFPAGTAATIIKCCTIGNRNFVYVTNQNPDPENINNLYAFEMNSDGSLTELPSSPIATGVFTTGLTCCSINGNTFLYAANIFSSNISAFQINLDGSLTELTNSPFAASTPTLLNCANINGANYLYSSDVTNGNIDVYSIDISGNLTFLQSAATGGLIPSGFNICSVGASNFLYAANQQSETISGFLINGDGSLILLSGFPLTVGDMPTLPSCCSINGNIFLYVTISGDNLIRGFQVNLDGSLIEILGSPFPAGTNPSEVKCCNVNGTPVLYVTNFGSNDISAFNIDNNGALTPLEDSPFPTGTNPRGFACCSIGNNQYLYTANFGSGEADFNASISSFRVVTPSGVLPTTLDRGTVGQSYSIRFTSPGLVNPVSWSYEGNLPPGLRFNPQNGRLSGTPAQRGLFAFSITASDGNNCPSTQNYTINIIDTPAPVPSPTFNPNTEFVTENKIYDWVIHSSQSTQRIDIS